MNKANKQKVFSRFKQVEQYLKDTLPPIPPNHIDRNPQAHVYGCFKYVWGVYIDDIPDCFLDKVLCVLETAVQHADDPNVEENWLWKEQWEKPHQWTLDDTGLFL